MAYRTSIFVDFWNFSLQWRNRASGDRIDWPRVPSALLSESERQLQIAGFGDSLHLEETLVYASYDEDEAGRRLKGWFDAFLDKQPRFRVNTRLRRSKPRSVYCRACEQSIDRCPHCEEPMRWSPEKGVDTAIVTGLLSLAGESAFDAAILVSSDTDYLPAVEYARTAIVSGLKVPNATTGPTTDTEIARARWVYTPPRRDRSRPAPGETPPRYSSEMEAAQARRLSCGRSRLANPCRLFTGARADDPAAPTELGDLRAPCRG